MRKQTCIFCGGEASLLCDGVLGWGLVMDGDRRCCDIRKRYTCDALMCNSCATNKGYYHFSHGWDESIDFCPLCIPNYTPIAFSKRIFDTPEQVLIFRKAHHARNNSQYAQHMSLLVGGGQQRFDF